MILKTKTIDMTHEDWLAERRKAIGGSDAGAVIGLNKYRSAFDVYADKKGIAPEVKDNEAMRQGRDLEEYVAQRFSEQTGKKVRRENAILKNTDFPFAAANIDRAIIGEKAGLECKTTSVLGLKRYKNGEFPEEYYAQCMHYLMVTGWERWYLAVLVFGTEFKVFTIERDEDEINALAEAERDFWDNYILGDKIPATAGTETTESTIKTMYPTDNGTDIDVTCYTSELNRITELAKLEKDLQTEKKALQQKLQCYMGECSYGFTSRHKVSWKASTRTSYDIKSIIKAYVPEGTDLSKYTTTTTSRRFLVTEI